MTIYLSSPCPVSLHVHWIHLMMAYSGWSIAITGISPRFRCSVACLTIFMQCLKVWSSCAWWTPLLLSLLHYCVKRHTGNTFNLICRSFILVIFLNLIHNPSYQVWSSIRQPLTGSLSFLALVLDQILTNSDLLDTDDRNLSADRRIPQQQLRGDDLYHYYSMKSYNDRLLPSETGATTACKDFFNKTDRSSQPKYHVPICKMVTISLISFTSVIF